MRYETYETRARFSYRAGTVIYVIAVPRRGFATPAGRGSKWSRNGKDKHETENEEDDGSENCELAGVPVISHYESPW